MAGFPPKNSPKKNPPKAPKAPKQEPTAPAPTPNMRAASEETPAAPPEPTITVPTTLVDLDDSQDGVVTLTRAQLEELLNSTVAKAVAAQMRAQHVESAGATGGSLEGIEERIARAVATVLVANQNNTANLEHAARLKMLQEKEAKLTKCSCCRNVIKACGGPWVKKVDIERYAEPADRERLTALKADREGYLLEPGSNTRRLIDETLNHTKMVIWPKDDTNAEYFIGLRLNGVLYASSGPGHAITVPKDNDFPSWMNSFEEGEKRSRTPRKHIRQSGSVGPNGTNLVKPTFLS